MATAKNDQILRRPRDRRTVCQTASEGLPPPAEGSVSGLVLGHRSNYSTTDFCLSSISPKKFSAGLRAAKTWVLSKPITARYGRTDSQSTTDCRP